MGNVVAGLRAVFAPFALTAPTRMKVSLIIDVHTLASKHMTDTDQQAVPHGFTQLTEGRIRTTDIICGESGGWSIPHVFLVGGDIGKDGRRIARPHVKKPASRR
jgi:hypothetical protein